MAKAFSSAWSSALAGGADTIVARSTAAGPAALAVVRMSGPETRRITARVSPAVDFGKPWRARLVVLALGDECAEERAVVIPYAAPASYTGEDMVELMVHGSPYLVQLVVDGLVAEGARLARPGEFTRRAVANGKIDLIQAEAVRDLVAAETEWQARNAREQLGGRLSKRVGELREQLIALQARLEASLDFSAQGVEADHTELSTRLARCRREVAALLATAGAGERIRDGVRVVISGPPNAGKSTLFNALLGNQRAIVAVEPGTTRDVLEAELEIGGLKITLVDTAGIRPSADPVESEGVRRAQAAVAGAGVVIELWQVGDEAGRPALDSGEAVTIGVRSKADLAGHGWRVEAGWLAVSCVSGEGLDELRGLVEETVSGRVSDLGGEVAIGRRHRRSLAKAADELAECDLASPELAAESVRWAASAVNELIGGVATEDVLDEVFASFCIGK